MISDLHLGEGLTDPSRPHARLESELCAFVDHHRQHRRGGRPWRLVINGDMVDFIAVGLMPSDVEWIAGLDPDDHLYGLGGSAHAASMKMRRVVEHHRDVFLALARFVGEGHDLELVMGNHDAEFHWPEVQALLRAAIAGLWTEHSTHTPSPGVFRTAAQVADAVRFHPWFFYEDGVAWIEHGHQVDPYCSFDEVLAPTTDGSEIDPNIGALLLRYVVSQCADDMSDAWGHGFFGYLRIWFANGLDRAAWIGLGYVDLIRRVIRHWSGLHPERLAARSARARARLGPLAARMRLPLAVLLDLKRGHAPPMVGDLGRAARAVMLDRLVVLLAAPLLLLLPVLLLDWGWLPWAWLLIGLPVGLGLGLALQAREPVDPRHAMRVMARRIRASVRVPIVVMGHSHSAWAERDGRGWYFNTGTWVPHPNPGRAFTHVRIEHAADGLRAALCQWRDGTSRAYDPDAEDRLLVARVPAAAR